MTSRPIADPAIVDPDYFQRFGYPHEQWSALRRDAPVAWCEPERFDPFWALTRHEDIVAVSRQPSLFENTLRLAMVPDDVVDLTRLPLRHLLNMNPPEHRDYRKLVSRFFTRRSIESLRADVERSVAEVLQAAGERLDFVEAVASRVPLAVIARILGLPREDWAQFVRWTNQIVGCADPEFQTEGSENAMVTALQAQFAYFRELVVERRRRPEEDLTSVLATAEIAGEPIGETELLSFLFLLITAGNETTRNALSGGVLALMEQPEALVAMRGQPHPAEAACEEVLRWTSPVVHLCRRATRDVELRGQKILAGETIVLFFPSANRDAAVFDEPFHFHIDRRPNAHLAFGTGEHACLGSHLARLEIGAVLSALADRVERIEATGPAVRLRGSFVGGIKSLPIRWTLRDA